MKKLHFASGLLACITLLFLGGCENAETVLNLSVTSNPDGGNEVGLVSCTFQGYLEAIGGGMLGSKETETISVTAEWWWENADHENAELKDSETFTFSTETPTSFTTTYSAGTGYILLNYYWVKLTWTDADGSHTLESGKAFCQY
jgi:hypothetical protein